jgi:hypothetical protein
VANRCTVCAHPSHDMIDEALHAPGANMTAIARDFGLSKTSLYRHRERCAARRLAASPAVRAEVAALVAEVREARAEVDAFDLMGRIRQQHALGDKLAAACEEYLTDPDDPERFYVGPRSADVAVVYADGCDDRGRPIFHKATLEELLERCAEAGLPVVRYEGRHADPRELVVKLLTAQNRQTELLARVLGKINDGAAADVLASPEWADLRRLLVEALAPFPDAAAAVAVRLMQYEAEHGARN